MDNLKTLLILFFIFLALVVGCRDPMEHAHCDDTVVKRVLSPDSKLVIVIYNRSCSGGTGLYTYAEVEDPSVWFSWPRHPEVCFLVTLAGGYHQMDAAWKDDKQIDISSADELDKDFAISSQHDTCNDIAVTYNFKFKPPPIQEAPDPETVAAIREAIKRSVDCIDEKLGAGHSDHLRLLVDDKQHRYALELLCTNLDIARCPISKETYALLEVAGTKMGIGSNYLENLKPLVR